MINDQFGCPTYAQHIASVTKELITHYPELSGIFHYSDEAVCTWYDFACAIQEYLVDHYKHSAKNILPINTNEYPTAAVRPKYSVLNCEKIKRAMNIKQYAWKEGIKEVLGALQA